MFGNLTFYRVLALSLLILIVHWLLKGVHRLYFHKLSHFPGPRFSAFTRLPYIIAVATGQITQYVARLHEKYGEVVRISPDELSFLHPQAWRDIYGHGSKEGKGSAPPKFWPRYQSTQVNGVPSLISIQGPAEHARARKIFSPAFSDRALTQQSPLFMRYAEKLVTSLQQSGKDGATFDMVRMYNFTTFDVMGDLTFGEPLHMLDSAEYDPWVSIIFDNIKRGVQLGLIYDYYPLVGCLFRALLHKKVSKLQHEHSNYSVKRVTKRLEKGRVSEGVDLWDLILQEQEKGKAGLTRDEMNSNASIFMVAGTETTATLLSGLTFLLLTHPKSMEKLVDEIRGTFSSSYNITMEAIAGLPYLNACIKEALRRYPPVPGGPPHKTPADGSTICGHYVPPNVFVAAHQLPTYTSPTFFRDPLDFVPERWTGDPRYANDERAVVQPFSVGSRDCLGKNMAYHEMRLLLAKVVYNFDLELRPQSQEWLQNQRIFTLWEKMPLLVKVKPVSA
ncbi:cytochrome P450 [Paraphoma chrysanthemicola]|nr:cytochrome P450 [Paraphoma chrysanthemicola]